ncbi:MAG: hypothetical protein ACRBDL_01745 [Alphaproteobacteria bacterium]
MPDQKQDEWFISLDETPRMVRRRLQREHPYAQRHETSHLFDGGTGDFSSDDLLIVDSETGEVFDLSSQVVA